jgi:hypothetical protein
MTQLDANDLIDLSLLLLVRDQSVTTRTAIPAVQGWGAPAFQPTGDVVAGRLWDLIRAGLVRIEGPWHDGALEITEEGRGHAVALLGRQDPGNCAPVHLSYALRLALAAALPEAAPHPA